MSNNRSLISMNWQEASNGVWYADTTNYRCVAVEKSDEAKAALGSFSKDDTWDSIVYFWNEVENSWIMLEKGLFGAHGCEDAKLWAERALGQILERNARKSDPSQKLFDQLNRVVENAQLRDMERSRFDEDPRMRGLPPGHPPIRRRDTTRDSAMSIGRSFERDLEQRMMMPPPSMPFTSFPTLSDIGPVGKSMKEMEADLKKHLDEKFPDRNKGE